IYRASQWRSSIVKRWGLREQLRRARASGVRVRRVDPGALSDGAPLRREVLGLAEERSERAQRSLKFLLAFEPFEGVEHHRYYAAERNGCVVAFLSAVPIYVR